MFKRRFLGTMLIGAMLALSFVTPVMAASTKTLTGGSVKLTNSEVTPFTVVNVGGGTWDYGTRLYGLTQKQVWSNYQHPTKYHHSACQIGTNNSPSGIQPPRTPAVSSAVGGRKDPTQAWWGLDPDPKS